VHKEKLPKDLKIGSKEFKDVFNTNLIFNLRKYKKKVWTLLGVLFS